MHSGELSRDESSNPRDEPEPNRRIALVRGGAIRLESEGFRIVNGSRRKPGPLHLYESMTHVHVAVRALLIGMTSGLLTIRNRDFEDPEAGPAATRSALLTRLAERPDGRRRLEEMADIDRLGDRKAPSMVTWAVILLCVIGTGFQLSNPTLEQFGAFIPDFFLRGEYWRAVTAHFLHGLSSVPPLVTFLFGDIVGLPFHLALNVGGLFVLGHLVERPLGSWRTAIVVGMGGVGTIVGIVIAQHFDVIGASGLVSAFAGAILAIELNYPSSIPSHWRLPRRIFIGAVLLQFVVIDQLLSRFVAGGAHLGGFAGGFLAVWILGRPGFERLRPSARVRFSTYAVIGVSILGVLGALPLIRHDQAALERHAIRILDTPARAGLYRHENVAAWVIATDGDASPRGLELAVALADRAVESTDRMFPGILDTLAEALFQSGNRLGALLTIDEAIRLMPREPYFFEQRRRFTGERAADDRPPPPGTRAGDAPRSDEELEERRFDPKVPTLTI